MPTRPTRQQAERRRLRLALAVLAACLLGTALLDDPALHGEINPGPNAPAYVNWRTGEVIEP
jgi:hypothetical protein